MFFLYSFLLYWNTCDFRCDFWKTALSVPRRYFIAHMRARQLVPESYDPKYYELQHGRIQDGYLIKKKLFFYEKRAEVIII